MARVSDSWRRSRLREALRDAKEASHKLTKAVGYFSEVADGEVERDACDALEQASDMVDEAVAGMPDPDSDEFEADEEE